MRTTPLLSAISLSLAFFGALPQANAAESLPWKETFASGTIPSTFTIVNANNDAHTWQGDMMGHAANLNTNLHNNDDWLITPAFEVEAGKAYLFSLDAEASFYGIISPSEETLEVKWGYGNSVDDLTFTAIENTTIKGDPAETLQGWITPTTSGTIHIGIHGTSSPGHYFLTVRNLKLDAGIGATRPGSVTELTATPDPDGKKMVDLSFRSPELDIAGDPLTSDLTQIEILRDNKSIHIIETPARGTVYTYTDNTPSHGPHTYSVIASTSAGAGDAATANAYVGAKIPAKPENVKVAETDIDGDVRISWTGVTLDFEGNPINPQLVKYNVYQLLEGGREELVGENVADNEFIHEAAAADEQTRLRYAVAAVTEAGPSDNVISDIIIAGPAYPTPFAESFFDGQMGHVFMTSNIEGQADWYVLTEDKGIPSSDGDNGFMCQMAENGASSDLTTGKIDLAGLESPRLSFYTYNIARMAPEFYDVNELEVLVKATDEAEFTSVKKVVMKDLGDTEGWYLVIVPMNQYKDKTIQVKFIGYCHGMTYTLLDNIRVENGPEFDIAVKDVTVPEAIKPNEKFDVTATIENLGSKALTDYELTLTCNDKLLSTVNGPEIQPGATMAVKIPTTLTPVTEQGATFKVEASLSNDADKYNNSAKVKAEVYQSGMPAPATLTATLANGVSSLSWTAPDLTQPGGDLTYDTFEDATPWATETVGGWTFVDRDQQMVYGIPNVDFPGISQGDKLSWFVVNGTGYNPLYFTAHSGSQYLGQLYVCSDISNPMNPTYADCDDWAISPALSGNAQAITFWARSMNADSREKFEVYESTSGTEISDFSLIEKVDEVPASWTKYQYRLPEGTTRFAIRCTSFYAFMLMLDDVKYESLVAPEELNFLGYNIYRNGERVNSEPVTDTTWSEPSDGSQAEYHVTALYAKGESTPTNSASTSSLSSTLANSSISIIASNGQITVNGAEGLPIRVYTASGSQVASAIGSASTTLTVAPGIYIVSAGTKTAKAYVK